MAARVTQSGLLSGGSGAGTARATQGALLVLAAPPAPGRVTQSYLLAGVHATPRVTSRVQCWQITREDGEVFAFTAHDRDMVFRGQTHRACASLTASAAELAAQLGSIGNLELGGILADDAIAPEDLFSGKFDNAAVEVWLAPWSSSGGETAVRIAKGRLGKVSQARSGWKGEVLTPAAQLEQKALTNPLTPGCRWDLGDSRCGVDLGALEVAGTATSVTANKAVRGGSRRDFTDSARAETTGYFSQGRLTWTSGANSGLSADIKDFSASAGGGRFTLWQAMPHDIAAGDGYTATPGCDKTAATCKATYSNYTNFGGFPDVPGRDAMIETPDQK